MARTLEIISKGNTLNLKLDGTEIEGVLEYEIFANGIQPTMLKLTIPITGEVKAGIGAALRS